MAKTDRIVPVILAGGVGTRLWPNSRQNMPKQFIREENSLSTFQAIIECFSTMQNFAAPIVLTNRGYVDIVADQLRTINVKPEAIVSEPKCKNTAGAMIVAAEYCRSLPDERLLFVPSDHHISNYKHFLQSILAAAIAAKTQGKLTAFGVLPLDASPEYGYICQSSSKDQYAPHDISCFIEKPPQKDAEWLVQRQDVRWNAGIYLVTRRTLLSEFCSLAPKLTAHAALAVKEGIQREDIFEPAEKHFNLMESSSFDSLIMEKTAIGVCAQMRDEWQDHGNWRSIWQSMKKDRSRNATAGNVYGRNNENCLAISNGPAVGVVGLKDVLVVANDDAVLVTTKDNSNEVRFLVRDMKKNDDRIAKQHRMETRPWGEFCSLKVGDGYQTKSIKVKPGGQLSLQYHHHRAEHWIVTAGTATVTIGKKVKELRQGDSVFIPCGEMHRLENFTSSDVEIIEVQIGDYLGEDDIVRVEDIYTRAKTPGAVV